MRKTVHKKVLLRGEQSDGAVSIVESTMPPGAPGPPLHSHAFDEGFYVLDGELTFRVGNEATTAKAGELVFAPRGVPHTLANRSDAPARYLLVFTPAGFEREFGRRAAKEAGKDPATVGAAAHPRSQLSRSEDRPAALTGRRRAPRRRDASAVPWASYVG